MDQLIKVETIQDLKYNTDAERLEPEDRRKLWDLGFHNETPNNSLKETPSAAILEEAAFVLSKYYGRITKYYAWPCPVCTFRIVFGN